MLDYACPFALDEVKPRSFPVRSNHEGLLKRLVNGKLLVLLLSLLFLVIVYRFNYTDMNWEGSTVIFNEWFIVKMSFYTYLASLISFFLFEYKRKQR